MAAVVYDARLWAQQHRSEIIAAATLAAAVGIVGVATAAVILTGGAAAIPMTILAGALIGGTAGAAGQLVQDLITGQKPRLENYLLPAAVGALGGAAAGLVVLGGAALGLSTVAVGAATGLSVGAISRYAINRLSGQPWHTGVGQMALAGGIGGAVGGLIASRFLFQNAGLATHMLVEGLSDALVSAGTQVGLNVAAGQAPFMGVGTAFAVGMTTGAVGGAVGHLAEGWSQRRALAKWKETGFDESGALGRWQDVTDAWARAGFDLNDPDVRWMIERGRGPVIGGSGRFDDAANDTVRRLAEAGFAPQEIEYYERLVTGDMPRRQVVCHAAALCRERNVYASRMVPTLAEVAASYVLQEDPNFVLINRYNIEQAGALMEKLQPRDLLTYHTSEVLQEVPGPAQGPPIHSNRFLEFSAGGMPIFLDKWGDEPLTTRTWEQVLRVPTQAREANQLVPDIDYVLLYRPK